MRHSFVAKPKGEQSDSGDAASKIYSRRFLFQLGYTTSMAKQAIAFTDRELHVLRKLKTPKHIQDFLETLPINFEKEGDTFMSPVRVLREKKAHCLEGAVFAAAALARRGHPPLLLDLETTLKDESHVVAIFRERGRFGAVSKTNHAVLRYRDPVYRSVRELAVSYFHEYFLDSGEKTLRSYGTLNLTRFNRRNWTTDEKDLWYIESALVNARHFPIVTPAVASALPTQSSEKPEC